MGNVRMIVQWSGGGRVSVSTRHSVVMERWSREAQRCKRNTRHGYNSATCINREIQRFENAAHKVMCACTAIPSHDDVRQALLMELGLAKGPMRRGRDLLADFNAFVAEQSHVRSWSMHTVSSFLSLRNTLMRLFPVLTYQDLITEEGLNRVIEQLNARGLKASTVQRYITLIRWFLRGAKKRGWVDETPSYAPTIKTTRKKVIYLTEQELMKLFHAPLEHKADRRVRDFFCFCCFTGLRHSDAMSLQRTNVCEGMISLVSHKDTDNLHIELNNYSSAILKRVELTEAERACGYVLPHVSLADCNVNIRRIARHCDISVPLKTTHYAGGKRVEEEHEKWELISTHTGRKTFICMALSHNISPNIVMKWTGHSNYEAMRPYIDIIDDAKRSAMAVFNSISAE